MPRPLIAAIASVLTAGLAFASSGADIERVRQTPRHFMCKLDQLFLGNVHSPGEASGTTHNIIQQSTDRGTPVPATIEMQISPATKNGNGVATGGLWPELVMPGRRPIPFELQQVRILFYDQRQTISFVLKGDTFMLPLVLVEAPSHQWWLSISSAVYPNTRTHDYRCEDLLN
jgi:hypothetical protein